MLVSLLVLPLLALNGAKESDSRTLLALAVGVTGFLSFAAFIGAAAVARAAAVATTAAGLAWESAALAGLTGWFLADVVSAEAAPLAIRLIMASALILVTAAASALAARVHPMPLFALSLTALFMLASASFMVLYIGQEIRVAAITLVVMAFLTTFLPTLSYRIAGIALPNLPVTTEAMLADETPVQSDIVARALLADRLLGAMLVASAATAALSTFLVITQGTIWSTLLVACVGLAFMLRARAFVGLTQRLALLFGGATAAGVAALSVAAGASTEPAGHRAAVCGRAGSGLPVRALLGVHLREVLSPNVGPLGRHSRVAVDHRDHPDAAGRSGPLRLLRPALRPRLIVFARRPPADEGLSRRRAFGAPSATGALGRA